MKNTRIFETYAREVRNWRLSLPRNEWRVVIEREPPARIRLSMESTRRRFEKNNPEIMEAWRRTFELGALVTYEGTLFLEGVLDV